MKFIHSLSNFFGKLTSIFILSYMTRGNTFEKYNIDKKNIIKDFINYIIRNYPKYLSRDFLNYIENLLHSQSQNNNVHIYYSLLRLSSLLSI